MTKRDLLIDFLGWYQRNTQEEGTCNEKWMDEATVDSYLNQPQLQQHGVVRGAVTSHCISNDVHNCPFTQTCPECTKPATEPLPAEALAQNGRDGFYCISGTCEKQCLYCQNSDNF